MKIRPALSPASPGQDVKWSSIGQAPPGVEGRAKTIINSLFSEESYLQSRCHDPKWAEKCPTPGHYQNDSTEWKYDPSTLDTSYLSANVELKGRLSHQKTTEKFWREDGLKVYSRTTLDDQEDHYVSKTEVVRLHPNNTADYQVKENLDGKIGQFLRDHKNVGRLAGLGVAGLIGGVIGLHFGGQAASALATTPETASKLVAFMAAGYAGLAGEKAVEVRQSYRTYRSSGFDKQLEAPLRTAQFVAGVGCLMGVIALLGKH